jgi:hypothetical protein
MYLRMPPVGNLTGKEKSFSTKKMHDFYLNLAVLESYLVPWAIK